MENISGILMVAGLFIVRIGIPLLILLGIGMLVENSYRRKNT
jgi:hypothetical protein